MNYYNEFDPQAAQWLRNLISAGLIPPGDVDERSIEDVIPNELRGYTQHHFFAGIGGWSLALDIAGWPRSRPIVTGSCPCQPFSAAGKGDGFADQRHLWPAWFHLIRQCKPNVVFGEQVASAIRHGWLDLVSADLEAEGYAVGASVLGAHSVGAPHIRQRLYWMAHSSGARSFSGAFGGVHRGEKATGSRHVELERHCGSMGDTSNPRSQGHGRPVEISDAQRRQNAGRHSSASGFWAGEWRTGADGKARLVKPGLEPLVAGLPRGMVYGGDSISADYANSTAEARTTRLRAYGNAICPQTAAAFIAAYMAGESVVELAA